MHDNVLADLAQARSILTLSRMAAQGMAVETEDCENEARALVDALADALACISHAMQEVADAAVAESSVGLLSYVPRGVKVH